jgi:hypothetical protein
MLQIGKAYQRKIRDQKKETDTGGLFGYPTADIKNAKCKEITFDQAKTIILEYEWLGTMGTTQIHYGIFFDDILAGAICFGFFQAMQGYSSFVGNKYSKMGIQLSRGACAHWAHEHSASKLIGYGLRELEKKGYKFCIAFSDPDAGEIGTVYQATNWYYLGFGKTKHKEVYCKITGQKLASSQDLYKKGTKWENFSMANYDNSKYIVKEKTPKARYIKLLGNRHEKKEMLNFLKDKICKYPKRQN